MHSVAFEHNQITYGSLFLLLMLYAFAPPAISAQGASLQKTTRLVAETHASTADELISTINAYRVANGLPAIAPSRTLNLVAKLHVDDLQVNNPDKGICNMHSWSNAGDWSACCYKDINPKTACMWNKPREISGSKYSANGYEVSAWLSEQMNAESALALWKKSSGHHEVIMNRGSWSAVRWRAIGAAMSENYAVVWFGTSRDAPR
ncbi:MAG: CAP domain-containing protein [Rhodothermales bacterium]